VPIGLLFDLKSLEERQPILAAQAAAACRKAGNRDDYRARMLAANPRRMNFCSRYAVSEKQTRMLGK